MKGINLHDIQTKINTFRLTHIGRIISQPHSHPLAHYYIGIQLNKLTKLNNQTRRTQCLLHRMPTNINKNNEKLIHDTSQSIFQKLVQKLSTLQYNRIQWCRNFALTDTTDTFRNNHTQS